MLHTVVSGFLGPFAPCNHTCDYSTRTAEAHVLIAIRIRVRLRSSSNTLITWVIAVCNGQQDQKTTVKTTFVHTFVHNNVFRTFKRARTPYQTSWVLWLQSHTSSCCAGFGLSSPIAPPPAQNGTTHTCKKLFHVNKYVNYSCHT